MNKIVWVLSVATLSLNAKPLIIGASKGIVKNKAYYTCRYEVQKLLRQLEEFDDVRAKVTYTRLRKRGDTYLVRCRFADLVGRRGILRFPVQKVTFRYRGRPFDFVIDGATADDWPQCAGIFHGAEDEADCSAYHVQYSK